MRKSLFVALLIALLVLPFAAFAQQNNLTSTTLSAAVPGQILGQGSAATPVPAPVTIQVTSATGIVGINPNLGVTASQPNQTALFVDDELMYVIAVNGTTLTVARGQSGTQASAHTTGAVVWIGKPYWFYRGDPTGACTAANVIASPWINVVSGTRWLCDSGTGVWQPVFSTGSITPVATAASIGTTAQTFTVTGVVTGEPIFIVSQPAPTSLCPLVAAKVTALNTVSLYWTTLTAAACTPASGTYLLMVPRSNIPLMRAPY